MPSKQPMLESISPTVRLASESFGPVDFLAFWRLAVGVQLFQRRSAECAPQVAIAAGTHTQEPRVDALRAPPIIMLNSEQIISSQLNSSVSGSAHLCLSGAGNAGVTILLVAIAMVLSLRVNGEIPARYGTRGENTTGKPMPRWIP